MKKRCMISRKGYFFLIDSILALGVLVIGAFLVFTTYTNVPSKEEVTILSEDVMDFFANNKIKNVNNPYTGVGGELWNLGLIYDAENTLLQQIGVFYVNNNLSIAEKFIVNLTDNTVPQQYLFEFWMNRVLVYPQNPSKAHNDSKNFTAVLIPSRKIVHGILNKDTGNMFGPYEAEVIVWQNT